MSTIIPSHWGHQTHFRVAAQVLAESVFHEIDVNLRPSILLVGLVMDHARDLYPLFVDAKGQDYSPTLFGEAARRAKAIRQTLYAEAAGKEEGAAGAKDADGDAARKRRLVLDAWRRAVEEVLAEEDEDRAVLSFCSAPRPVDEFLVCTVLQLNRRAYESAYALPQDEEDRRARRPASLLEAAVTEYLRKCAVGLAERQAGVTAATMDFDHEEILRSAGRALTDSPARAQRHDLDLQGLFLAANTISSLRYEGSAGVGSLVISRPGHPNLTTRLTLRVPVRLHDYVAVRKLLAACTPGYALLADGVSVYGMGGVDLAKSLQGIGLFHISFLRHYTWELAYGHRPLMRVSYGHPRLPRPAVLEHRLRFYATKAFGLLDEETFGTLWTLTLSAAEQSKGTILVFTPAAAEEALRLEKQATPVEPVPATPDTLRAVTAIDGAVLLTPSGVCHGIGAILDGRASARGNPARGARYNSALRYVEASEAPCLAVVVSEDGTVDLLTR